MEIAIRNDKVRLQGTAQPRRDSWNADDHNDFSVTQSSTISTTDNSIHASHQIQADIQGILNEFVDVFPDVVPITFFPFSLVAVPSFITVCYAQASEPYAQLNKLRA